MARMKATTARPQMNRRNTMWLPVKGETGTLDHSSGRARVEPFGKRFIAIVEGAELVGESGGRRYFGDADNAIAACIAALPELGQTAAVTEPEPVAVASSEKKARAPKVAAPAEPRTPKLAKEQAPALTADPKLGPLMEAHGFTITGEELRGVLGTVELSDARGSWVPKLPDGEHVRTDRGGVRQFYWPSKAVEALVAAAK